jgi:hypothetical protein
MAVLTSKQRSILVGTISFLQGNHDRPVDANVIDQLAKIFEGKTGFPCPCGVKGESFRDAMRDEPITTLLRIILAVSDAAPGNLS